MNDRSHMPCHMIETITRRASKATGSQGHRTPRTHEKYQSDTQATKATNDILRSGTKPHTFRHCYSPLSGLHPDDFPFVSRPVATIECDNHDLILGRQIHHGANPKQLCTEQANNNSPEKKRHLCRAVFRTNVRSTNHRPLQAHRALGSVPRTRSHVARELPNTLHAEWHVQKIGHPAAVPGAQPHH